MRYAILCLALLITAPAMAQNAPHNSGADYGATRRYSGAPLWRFTYYPEMPKAGERKSGYSYYPYAPYRSSYPADRYDRSKVQRYPVR